MLALEYWGLMQSWGEWNDATWSQSRRYIGKKNWVRLMRIDSQAFAIHDPLTTMHTTN